jgi:hypothetical protein
MGNNMFDKFRRKLVKAIAPKPKKRVKKQQYIYDVRYSGLPDKAAIEFVKNLMTDNSYHQYKRNKQADSVIGE